MKSPIILIIMGILFLPGAGHAQTGVEASAEAAARTAVRTPSPAAPAPGEAAVAATGRLGLPTATVRDAIADGRAHGASAAEIDRLALAAHARLNTSREALTRKDRPSPSAAEIEAGAKAIAAGARPSDLSRIRDAAPADRSVAVSLAAVAEMRRRGVESRHATAEVTAWLRGGWSDAEVATAARSVAGSADLRGGGPVRSTLSGAGSVDIGRSGRLGAAGAATGSLGIGLP